MVNNFFNKFVSFWFQLESKHDKEARSHSFSALKCMEEIREGEYERRTKSGCQHQSLMDLESH